MFVPPSKKNFYFHFYYVYLNDIKPQLDVVMITYLELHGRVLLILWRGVALVVKVVWGGGVNDGGLLGRLMDTLTVDIDQEGQ